MVSSDVGRPSQPRYSIGNRINKHHSSREAWAFPLLCDVDIRHALAQFLPSTCFRTGYLPFDDNSSSPAAFGTYCTRRDGIGRRLRRPYTALGSLKQGDQRNRPGQGPVFSHLHGGATRGPRHVGLDLLRRAGLSPPIFELNRAVAAQALAPHINSIAAWLVVRWRRPDRARFRTVRSRAKWRGWPVKRFPASSGSAAKWRTNHSSRRSRRPRVDPTRKSGDGLSGGIGCVSLLSLDLPACR